ncbi:MAG TPA: SRPBCC domain-containing protein [Bacteroidia bacterium]|nr:SRPBCC domain-containing protein [Bacteroidia bacterium]
MRAICDMKKLDLAALRAAAAVSPDRPAVIRSIRTIPHSPEEFFAAFVDGESLARWWGPSGFSSEFETFDFRPGGDWIFDMIGPDGTHYRNESRFLAIEPPHRLVIEHLREVHYFLLTITLTACEGGTSLEWEMDFRDPEEVARVLPYVPRCNEELFDRLEAELARRATA